MFFYDLRSKLPAFFEKGISLDELLHVGVAKFDKTQAEILRGGAHNQKQVLLRVHQDVLKLSRRHNFGVSSLQLLPNPESLHAELAVYFNCPAIVRYVGVGLQALLLFVPQDIV